MERLTTPDQVEKFACELKGITPDELPKNFTPIISLTGKEFNEFMKDLYKLGGVNPHLFDINGINKYQSQAGITFIIIIE